MLFYAFRLFKTLAKSGFFGTGTEEGIQIGQPGAFFRF